MGDVIGRRSEKQLPQGNTAWERLKDAFRKSHENLFTMLAVDFYKGKARKRASLSLFIEDGMYRICLSDRETGEVAFVQGTDFAQVLGAMEAGLVNEELSWRPSRQFTGTFNETTPR